MATTPSPVTARLAVLAFDIGGTSVKAEVVGPGLTTWASASAPTPRGADLVDLLVRLADQLRAELPVDRRAAVASVGAVVPGLVDSDRGVCVYSANLGLREASLAAPLAERLQLPTRLGHDVTAAAEAERRSGAARSVTDPVIVVIGTGIAAVSYVHGRRVVGVTGQAGELGHVVVRPDGPPCGCGVRGCLEAVASASAIVRAYRARGSQQIEGTRDLVALLGRDPVADEVWHDALSALADGLTGATALLAPGAVVIGGGLAEAGPALFEPLTRIMQLGSAAVSRPPLLPAAFGSRAGVVGAALLGRDLLAERRAS